MKSLQKGEFRTKINKDRLQGTKDQPYLYNLFRGQYQAPYNEGFQLL